MRLNSILILAISIILISHFGHEKGLANNQINIMDARFIGTGLECNLHPEYDESEIKIYTKYTVFYHNEKMTSATMNLTFYFPNSLAKYFKEPYEIHNDMHNSFGNYDGVMVKTRKGNLTIEVDIHYDFEKMKKVNNQFILYGANDIRINDNISIEEHRKLLLGYNFTCSYLK
jgi:hypothetical protein